MSGLWHPIETPCMHVTIPCYPLLPWTPSVSLRARFGDSGSAQVMQSAGCCSPSGRGNVQLALILKSLKACRRTRSLVMGTSGTRVVIWNRRRHQVAPPFWAWFLAGVHTRSPAALSMAEPLRVPHCYYVVSTQPHVVLMERSAVIQWTTHRMISLHRRTILSKPLNRWGPSLNIQPGCQ